jgi:hypothetical protein
MLTLLVCHSKGHHIVLRKNAWYTQSIITTMNMVALAAQQRVS